MAAQNQSTKVSITSSGQADVHLKKQGKQPKDGDDDSKYDDEIQTMDHTSEVDKGFAKLHDMIESIGAVGEFRFEREAKPFSMRRDPRLYLSAVTTLFQSKPALPALKFLLCGKLGGNNRDKKKAAMEVIVGSIAKHKDQIFINSKGQTLTITPLLKNCPRPFLHFWDANIGMDRPLISLSGKQTKVKHYFNGFEEMFSAQQMTNMGLNFADIAYAFHMLIRNLQFHKMACERGGHWHKEDLLWPKCMGLHNARLLSFKSVPKINEVFSRAQTAVPEIDEILTDFSSEHIRVLDLIFS